MNPAYRALTARPDLDPVGRAYDEVWPYDGPIALPALRRVRDTGEPCHTDDHAVADRGVLRRFSFHVKGIPWRGGAGLLVVLWETTALCGSTFRVFLPGGGPLPRPHPAP